ncbi:(+)-abscisic acid 8'-hydroxylase [Marchantia polymorpha subsp. ruderalis]|uniref:Uncharacterized protein n=2 Tax=Marchantia polymorpha TaxID=3197 RepID=A0A176WM17_MARPO|nr:hypothetical protein AXG93_1658s1120 [Marchantia polymorpha subsp. ruderalis]PTQ43397.1 hypothetical protein MARPO_0025s0085 [Marchantia polymorpha]BBN03736.1 hypothetical protein Mp_2g25940 [Marchantia polymorpha subsp. ruderalis]|eukprot:PTQ43397.1 hypothetical protein MARPO_0025s0085 [Marchantia polymorpha]
MAGVGIWFLGFVAVIYVYYRVQKHLARSRRLPPGTMGWPIIGETMKFYTQHPNLFFSSKQKRYGEIVKTRILGYPAVMMATPEAAKLVLVTQAHLFKPSYPVSKEKLIGRSAVFFQHGAHHQRIRHLLQACFTPDVIRESVGEIESLALRTMNSWEGRSICTFAELKKFSFEVGFMLSCGNDDHVDKDELLQTYRTMEMGYNSMAINIPGFKFNKSMTARKRLHTIIAGMVERRRDSGVMKSDVLGTLMKDPALTLDQIADNVIGVVFAAQDTTASVMTWLVKYLSGSPSILADVKAEHDEIRASKSSDDEGLTYADCKNMPLTHRVILETLRNATVLSFTFREATEDVEYNGYLICKGWKVLPLFRNIHHNPDIFPDPYKFDPSRFEKAPKPNTFLPFGNGVHSCLGSELAKLEMFIFVHHLVTKFRWDLLEPKAGIDYRPFPVPKEGMPMRVSQRRTKAE